MRASEWTTLPRIPSSQEPPNHDDIFMHTNKRPVEHITMKSHQPEITCNTIVCSTARSSYQQRKHQRVCVIHLLWGDSIDDRWIPLTNSCKAENVSMWWHHMNSGLFLPHIIWASIEIRTWISNYMHTKVKCKRCKADLEVLLTSLVTLHDDIDLGPVLLTLLRHVARISANGIAAFKESCAPID